MRQGVAVYTRTTASGRYELVRGSEVFNLMMI